VYGWVTTTPRRRSATARWFTVAVRLAGSVVLCAAAVALAACGDSDPSGPASEARVLPVEEVEEVEAGEPEPDASPQDDTDEAAIPAPTIAGEAPALDPAQLPIAEIGLKLTEIGTFEQPLDLATRPGDDALYIAEKTGRVRRVVDGEIEPEPWLDLSQRVSTRSERGLLGIEFTPDGSRFVASFSDRNGTSTIASWPAADRLDLGGEKIHLTLEQPFPNHNGGDIAYGPDGHLYVAFGDGGSAGDPLDAGQDTTTWLGAILRIDLTTNGFEPAPDNPLASPDRPEIHLWGLRNPWRMSFDRSTGELWIGDVGQDALEEIDVVAPTPAVRNLGWNRYEGIRRFRGDELDAHHPPILEYGRRTGESVTGGYVYRGEAIEGLNGAYFYADFEFGWVRALRLGPDGGVVEHVELFSGVSAVAGFGEDESGELYVISIAGPVYRLDPE